MKSKRWWMKGKVGRYRGKKIKGPPRRGKTRLPKRQRTESGQNSGRILETLYVLPAISLAINHLPTKLPPKLSQPRSMQSVLRVPTSGTGAARRCDVIAGGTSGSGEALPRRPRTTQISCGWAGEIMLPVVCVVCLRKGTRAARGAVPG